MTTKYKSIPRVVSSDELVDAVQLLLQHLDLLQLVVVSRRVAVNTHQCCQLLHQHFHGFVPACCCRTRNPQSRQDRGVYAMAVAQDDIYTQRFARVDDMATLIHRKREDHITGHHPFPHDAREELCDELGVEN